VDDRKNNLPQKSRRIRFCVSNPRGLDERNALIAAGHECLGCLGNCTRCFETRFLEIDNRFVEGDDYGGIIASVETKEDQAE
jgi:uncharacterized protein YuzB (UPF0349 family)